VKVFGDDPEQNREAAEAIASAIQSVPSTSEVMVEQTAGQGYLTIRMNRSALARYGIPIEDVQEVLQVAIAAEPVAQAVDGAYNSHITVQQGDRVPSSPEAIGVLTVPTPNGALIPRAQLAEIRREAAPVQVSREQAQRLVIVQANVRGQDLGSYVAEVQEAIAGRVELPPGVFLTYGGQFENQERAMRRLCFVVPVSIALIALLLYASLQSWRLASLVLLNLPFAAVGGVIALWVRDLNLGVSAAVGFIALFG